MTVRCQLSVGVAVFALVFGAGCRNRDAGQTVAETAEPAYVEAVRLNKQARYAEALPLFLEVIEKRGSRLGAPEAHFEAGLIYLYRLKDPNEAIYHFKRYLAALPNSKEAPLVRGKLDEATREFARTLPARPLEDQSVRLESAEEIARLRRENAELRAENATLQTGMPGQGSRNPRGTTIDLSRLLSPAPADAGQPPVTIQTRPPESAVMQPPPRPAPVQPASNPPPNTGRTHTVQPRESAWSIARQYYGSATNNAKVEALLEANRVSASELQPGMVLKIP
jgi:tetratricopeptide (TPR) repeat protein